jgi:hypothetical protein
MACVTVQYLLHTVVDYSIARPGVVRHTVEDKQIARLLAEPFQNHKQQQGR